LLSKINWVYIQTVRTVIEIPTFKKQADAIWTTHEREAFIDFIAENPDAGDVIPGADGARKVRWQRQGAGNRGGARVIYFPPGRRRGCAVGHGLRQGRTRQRQTKGHQAELRA
jgi:hypothetical protein